MDHSDSRLRYSFGSCGTPNTAMLKLIRPSAPINVFVPVEGREPNSHYVEPRAIDLKRYGGCVGTYCELKFYGDRP